MAQWITKKFSHFWRSTTHTNIYVYIYNFDFSFSYVTTKVNHLWWHVIFCNRKCNSSLSLLSVLCYNFRSVCLSAISILTKKILKLILCKNNVNTYIHTVKRVLCVGNGGNVTDIKRHHKFKCMCILYTLINFLFLRTPYAHEHILRVTERGRNEGWTDTYRHIRVLFRFQIIKCGAIDIVEKNIDMMKKLMWTIETKIELNYKIMGKKFEIS